jgi:hypothetical protein
MQMTSARAVLCSTLLVGSASAGLVESEQTLTEFLTANSSRVVAYLRALPDEAIGTRVPGVTLTDGRREIAGYRYLGHAREPGPGAHVYLFADDGKRIAYVWVDEPGAPLPIPDCGAVPDDCETTHVLSGDVYTFKDLQPGDGVVMFHCSDDAVWQRWAPHRERQPTRICGPRGCRSR